MSSYYDREILDGLEKVPTPTTPGILVVTGDSQSVFTGAEAGDVLFFKYF
jgi:hypothetical protein